MNDRNIIPNSQVENNIFDFDILRMDAKEQERLLLKAAEDSTFNNEEIFQNRAQYEKDNKILPEKVAEFITRGNKFIGYCKSTECKKHHSSDVRHSVNYGPFVYYHCLKCLSELLCSARSESNNTCPVLIQFHTPKNIDTNEIPIQSRDHEFEIKLYGSKIYLNNIEVEYAWVPLTESDNYGDDYIKFKLIIYSKITVRTSNKKGYLTGIYKCAMKGRHVCKNIYTGKPCLSLKPDYKPQGFIAKSIPPGVPGWKENHTLTQEGRLIACEYCPACAIQNQEQNRPKIKSPSTKITPNRKEEDNLDYKKEYESLRTITNDLLTQVQKLQEENSSLRNKLVDIKAEILRERLGIKK